MARPASSYRASRRSAGSSRAVTPGAMHDSYATDLVRAAVARRNAGRWPGMPDAALDRLITSVRAANATRHQAQQAAREARRAKRAAEVEAAERRANAADKLRSPGPRSAPIAGAAGRAVAASVAVDPISPSPDSAEIETGAGLCLGRNRSKC